MLSLVLLLMLSTMAAGTSDPEIPAGTSDPEIPGLDGFSFPHVQDLLEEWDFDFEKDENGVVITDLIDQDAAEFDMIAEEFCRDAEDCHLNMFYPCKCAKSFAWFDSKKDECKKLPCNLLLSVKYNLLGVIQGLADAETYVDAVEAIRPMADGLSNVLCPCAKGFLSGLKGCLRVTTFRDLFMSEDMYEVLKSPAISRFWKALQGPLCSEGCGIVNMVALRGSAQLIDETRARSGTCLDKNADIERLGERLENIYSYSAASSVSEDWTTMIREVAGDFWCRVEHGCVRELDEAFNNCCTRSFLDLFNRRNMKSLAEMIGSDELMGVIRELIRGSKPEKSCRSKYNKPTGCHKEIEA